MFRNTTGNKNGLIFIAVFLVLCIASIPHFAAREETISQEGADNANVNNINPDSGIIIATFENYENLALNLPDIKRGVYASKPKFTGYDIQGNLQFPKQGDYLAIRNPNEISDRPIELIINGGTQSSNDMYEKMITGTVAFDENQANGVTLDIGLESDNGVIETQSVNIMRSGDVFNAGFTMKNNPERIYFMLRGQK